MNIRCKDVFVSKKWFGSANNIRAAAMEHDMPYFKFNGLVWDTASNEIVTIPQEPARLLYADLENTK